MSVPLPPSGGRHIENPDDPNEDAFIRELRKALAKAMVELSALDEETTVVVPDYAEALVGWRSWNTLDGQLISVASPSIWRPNGRMEAQCLFGRHIAPDEACTCGIYAVDRPGRVLPGEVVGKVALWGKVIPGTRGWRAQYAYPVELWTPSPGTAAFLRKTYGVPVHSGPFSARKFGLYAGHRGAAWLFFWVAAGLNCASAANIALQGEWWWMSLPALGIVFLAYLMTRK